MRIRYLRYGMHELERQEEKDKRIIKLQLKRKRLQPIVRVVKRCNRGFPQVVLNLPTICGKVWFPTIFWLTCPYLHYKISRIEGRGFIKVLEEKISHSPFLKDLLLDDQKECIFIKEAYFSFLRIYDPYGRIFFKKGIGGVSRFDKIKCLHLHYAFYIALGKGFVGSMVRKEIENEKDDPFFCGDEFANYCGRRYSE